MLFDGLWRNPGRAFPDFAALNPGYELKSGT